MCVGEAKRSDGYLLYNLQPFRVAPRSQRQVLLRLPDKLQHQPSTQVIIKPLPTEKQIESEVEIAWAVVHSHHTRAQDKSWTVPVMVVNPGHAAVTVPERTRLLLCSGEGFCGQVGQGGQGSQGCQGVGWVRALAGPCVQGVGWTRT